MAKHLPADELAEVRSEIARLRLREAALRLQILKDPQRASMGRWHRVEVAIAQDARLDPSLLPVEIRENPEFYRATTTQVLRCHAVAPQAQPRPGWPIRRDAQAMH